MVSTKYVPTHDLDCKVNNKIRIRVTILDSKDFIADTV